MRPDHRFRIASITKTFTATLVLQLVHERKLALSDTLGRLLPKVLPDADGVTVEQLLTHTSGIPDYLTDPRFMAAIVDGGEHTRKWPPRALLGYVGKLSRSGGYRYSNTNFILLGLIIEKATGQPYTQVLRTRIIEPLGLRATELPDDLLPQKLAQGEYGEGRGATLIHSSIFWSAGGLVSTVHDVAVFYQALFNGDLPGGKELAHKSGFGIFSQRLPCGIRVWNHSGMINGYSGVAMSSEDGHRQVVVQLNSSSAGDTIALAQRLMCQT
jgi:D-alanyl-D-alanine carboxypeptidase